MRQQGGSSHPKRPTHSTPILLVGSQCRYLAFPYKPGTPQPRQGEKLKISLSRRLRPHGPYSCTEEQQQTDGYTEFEVLSPLGRKRIHQLWAERGNRKRGVWRAAARLSRVSRLTKHTLSGHPASHVCHHMAPPARSPKHVIEILRNRHA